jgi:ankyrin repeat protein
MKTARSVKSALKGLPKTLEESYDVVYKQMLDLDLDARMTAENAVRWLLCAKRPLRSLEFMAALTVSKVEEASPLPEEEPRSAIEELLDICCNLIVLDESLDTFRMAHLSVREYFEQKSDFDKITVNSLAAESCIDTLMASDGIDEGFRDFKFYATISWPEHCQEISSDGPQGALAAKMKLFLFENGEASTFFKQWVARIHNEVHYWPDLKRAQRRKLEDSGTLPPTPQFVASSYGLSWILKEMVKYKSFDRDIRVRCGDTGFNLASIWGYKSIVEEFLHAGADIDVPGNDGRTPLIIAAEHGHQDLVRFLISKGANINATWAQGRTPLHEAVHWGQYAIAKILLDNGADIARCDRHGVSPLITSVQRDRTFIPGVFYDGDATITPEKNDNGTGLFYSGEMMRLLVDHGVDLLSPANRTALHEAVRSSNASAVKIFVEAGVDVNYADSEDARPLDYALGVGLADAVGILLTHGAIPGLRWEKTTYHVCQWTKEVWYPQLLQALDLGQGETPAPFIPMPEATETRISREDSVVITKDSPDIPYIWIRVPPNMTSVNFVKFTTDSHDQGIFDDN